MMNYQQMGRCQGHMTIFCLGPA